MCEMRKRKSLWDAEDEPKHLSGIREPSSSIGKDHHSSHGNGRYHGFSDSRTTAAQNSMEHSAWRPWESIQEHLTAPINSSFKNTPERKEIGGGKTYHKNISPGFGVELHNYDHGHESDRSHPQRYMGRGRSRRQSTSRTRGRSRSRSLSRGRERERVRIRGRSRSRSRRDGNANDHRKSRSPIRDYKGQSYIWIDKRSGPKISSQTCRDFTSGRCRRGSQCRFFHPNSTSCRDDDLVEDNTVESWKSGADHSRIPKLSNTRSGFDSQTDVSDSYHREDEQSLNKNGNSVPCKDFMRGKCRFRETCRFSHRVASVDSFGQGTRNTSFDKDFDHQQHKSGKPLCKYFAAGKCNKDNCRFSHDDPNLNNLEGRVGEVTDSCSSHDKSNWWNALKWDDATRISDTSKPTGQGEAIVTNTASTGDTGNRQNDDRWQPWGNNFENESKKWGIQEHKSNHLYAERQCSLPWKNGSYGGDTGNRQNDDRWEPWGNNSENESKNWGIQERTGKSLYSEKQPSHPRQSGSCSGDTGNRQNDDRWEPWGDNSKNESKNWGIQERTGKSLYSEKQPSRPRESGSCGGDTGNTQNDDKWVPWGDNSENESKNCGIQERTGNSLYIGKQPSHPWESGSYGGDMGPAESIAEDNIINKQEDLILHGSQLQNKEGIVNLHGLNALQENQSFSIKVLQQNVYLASHIQQQHCRVGENNPMKSFGSDVLDEVTKVPQLLTNLLTSEHSDRVTNSPVTNAGHQVSPVTSPVSLKRFVNEQSLVYAGIDVSSSSETLPSFPSTRGCLPLVKTATVQHNPGVVSLDLLNSVGNSRENAEHGNHNLAHGTELSNEMQLKRTSPSSVLGTEFDVSKAKPPESQKQQEVVATNLGVTGGAKAMGEESKGILENKPSKTLDGHVKPEEGSANKNEKGMRVFKNALVEFVKEILKPTWKEGRMSREVHKTVVKKAVDKVSSTIQVDNMPKTQDQVEQYLLYSKQKITKLVQAYVEHCQKADV